MFTRLVNYHHPSSSQFTRVNCKNVYLYLNSYPLTVTVIEIYIVRYSFIILSFLSYRSLLRLPSILCIGQLYYRLRVKGVCNNIMSTSLNHMLGLIRYPHMPHVCTFTDSKSFINNFIYKNKTRLCLCVIHMHMHIPVYTSSWLLIKVLPGNFATHHG